jgi:hypothetical protein
VNEDGIPVAETVAAVEVSGRDWPAEIDEATDADHLRELWRECKAWGEYTTELDAHFTTRAGKLADSPVEVVDAVEVHEDQATAARRDGVYGGAVRPPHRQDPGPRRPDAPRLPGLRPGAHGVRDAPRTL